MPSASSSGSFTVYGSPGAAAWSSLPSRKWGPNMAENGSERRRSI